MEIHHQCEKQMRSDFPPEMVFVCCVSDPFSLWPILHVLCYTCLFV